MLEMTHSERGKLAWRAKMRGLSVSDKLARLEKAIRHAADLERVKAQWKKSAKSSSSL